VWQREEGNELCDCLVGGGDVGVWVWRGGGG
jgi:hypothetical protein